ncbi:hypothetical protein ASR50_34805 [Streptomyces sp. 4F]|nr:hypothetical protein ASR50_00630 [Streptomyces sp. 4F]ALV54071.1 hypothetical protein ASR50_34805 [Streptomyces sp. 4F]
MQGGDPLFALYADLQNVRSAAPPGKSTVHRYRLHISGPPALIAALEFGSSLITADRHIQQRVLDAVLFFAV